MCFILYKKKTNLEITEPFLGSQIYRTRGASAVTGGEHGMTYVR